MSRIDLFSTLVYNKKQLHTNYILRRISRMSQGTKFCKHCGQIIDSDCVVCPKCGKQVENLNSYGGNGNGPILYEWLQ